MSNRKSFIYFILFFLLLGRNSFSQTDASYSIQKDSFSVNLQNRYYISSVSIIPGSEIINLNGRILSREEYNFKYIEGYFELTGNNLNLLNGKIFINYKSYITGLKKEYRKRDLVLRPESGNKKGDSTVIVGRPVPLSESVFGKGIQKSGSLIRGFQVGSNSDFTLNSGLRLQLSGKLSDDIEITAALSDENIPIQPEGNTERLNEIDKVFIQLKHKNITGTFGDYELKYTTGEFSRLNRRLQGLQANFNYSGIEGGISIASSRGKFNSANFNGMDGNQGPYRLYGANNENDITVIAGSEKVFVDGIEMKRGENNDYTMEYSSAMVTFTAKRIITSASRIVVDFEYTDRRFQRNFLGLNLTTKIFGDKLKLSFNYLREGDDQNNLIDYSLTDEEKSILEKAGNDRTKAVVSGVSIATTDSAGILRGIYSKTDTLVNGSQFYYYKYNPGASDAIYNIVFTYVGEGKGDYKRESLNIYKFNGIGKGSYLPVKYLPMPELKQNAGLLIESELISNTRMSFEFTGSLYNMNRFSGSNSVSGLGGNLLFELKPVPLNIFNFNAGTISFNFKERYLQGNYSPFDRINPVEFNREYNITGGGNTDEELRELGLKYLPSSTSSVLLKYGMVKKGDQFKSDRIVSELKYSDPEIVSAEYKIDYVSSKNLLLSSNWTRQNGRAYYSLWNLRPGIELLLENKNEKRDGIDSLLSTSLKFAEFSPYIELIKFKGFDLRTQISLREESFPLDGKMQKQSDAFMRSIRIGFNAFQEASLSLNITLRNKNYTDPFKKKGFTNNETFLIYSQNRFNFFKNGITGELYYEAATEQTAKMQKVFVKVLKGAGNYKYIGDVNKNGIADEADFELTSVDGEFIVVLLPTDELFPVVDLKTSARWNVDLSKFFTGSNLAAMLLKPISTETFIRIEENSTVTSTKDIYLLKLGKFLNDSTTIRGSNFIQQDLFIFRNARDLSIRGRFIQRKSIAQYAGGIEKSYLNEKSIRLRFQMVEEISNQTDYVYQADNYLAPSASNRSRLINKNDLSSDFSYRPDNSIEAGLKLSVGKIEDKYPLTPTVIYSNSQLLRINFSFAGAGRLRCEIERAELTANNSNFIPYEVTNGNQIGKNYFWRFFFDYRLAANFSASVNYDGRWYGRGKVIHSLRAEARAFF